MHVATELVRHSGNDMLFDAVELSLLSAKLGWPLHLHAEGVRGTGKTTVMRSARSYLPKIRRIRGCLYNCDPDAPHCPQHRDLGPAERRRLGTEYVPMPFLEISHSARLGTVVGTIDLQRVMTAGEPQTVLLPGTLAKAHRGIVFADEINRLADTAPELVDALLDVMGTKPGRLQIEESGLPPVELTVQVTVWAASNPDEEPGPLEDIRRQLADRFDMAVHVRRPQAVEQVRSVLDRTAGLQPSANFAGGARPAIAGVAGVAAAAVPKILAQIERQQSIRLAEMPVELRTLIAELYVRFDLESLRAVEAWQWVSRLLAWRSGVDRVRREDIVNTAPLVLHHRLEPEVLAEMLRVLRADRQAAMEMAASVAHPDTGSAGHDPRQLDGGSGTAGHQARQLGRGRAAMNQERSGLLAKLRTLLGDQRGGSAGTGGYGSFGYEADWPDWAGNGGERDGEAEIPAPPDRARPIEQLDDTYLITRMGLETPGIGSVGEKAADAHVAD